MRQKGNNKQQTWPLKKTRSTHFSYGKWGQEERGLNCTLRYFSNKVKFPDNEFIILELHIGRDGREYPPLFLPPPVEPTACKNSQASDQLSPQQYNARSLTCYGTGNSYNGKCVSGSLEPIPQVNI